jgi:hypothetical protein
LLDDFVNDTSDGVFGMPNQNTNIGSYVIDQNDLVSRLLGKCVMIKHDSEEDDKFYKYRYRLNKKGKQIWTTATESQSNQLIRAEKCGKDQFIFYLNEDMIWSLQTMFLLRFTLWQLKLIDTIEDKEDPSLHFMINIYIGLMVMRLSAASCKIRCNQSDKFSIKTLDRYG